MGKMIVDQSTISLAGMLLASALLFIGSTFCYYIIRDEFKQRQSNRNWLTIIFNAVMFVITFFRRCIRSLFDAATIISARRSSS